MKHPTAILTLALLLALAPASAQEPKPVRPVTKAFMAEIGTAHTADTYLSPVTFRGPALGLAYERFQAMKFDPERWTMMLNVRGDISRGRNRVGNALTWRIGGLAEWGMLRRWATPVERLTAALGGTASIDAGCLYNSRNGNNPASAKFAATLNLTGYVHYRLDIGRLPVALRWQPALPLVGTFFSPEYDELYYEIYLGNTSGLMHFAWPGNRFAMTNFVCADLQFGGTWLRVGYRSTVLSSKASHLVTNLSTNAFVIGLAGEWITLSTHRKADPDTKVINALY